MGRLMKDKMSIWLAPRASVLLRVDSLDKCEEKSFVSCVKLPFISALG